MSEEEPPSDTGSKNLPEGMRVVRKRRKKKKGSRQTLFLKKREILRDMHEDTDAVGVKEQVERLKTAKKEMAGESAAGLKAAVERLDRATEALAARLVEEALAA